MTRQGDIKPPIPWSAGRRNLHTRRTMVRERSRVVKIKNIKKQNLLYGRFKKQSTVVLKSGYQRQGGKEKDRKRDGLGQREREREREREKDITWGDRII